MCAKLVKEEAPSRTSHIADQSSTHMYVPKHAERNEEERKERSGQRERRDEERGVPMRANLEEAQSRTNRTTKQSTQMYVPKHAETKKASGTN